MNAALSNLLRRLCSRSRIVPSPSIQGILFDECASAKVIRSFFKSSFPELAQVSVADIEMIGKPDFTLRGWAHASEYLVVTGDHGFTDQKGFCTNPASRYGVIFIHPGLRDRERVLKKFSKQIHDYVLGNSTRSTHYLCIDYQGNLQSHPYGVSFHAVRRGLGNGCNHGI